MPLKSTTCPPIAVGFEKALQVLLRSAGLGEDQRLAGRARRGHLFEADVQRLEQRVRLGVDADAARPSGEPLQDLDLLAQFLPVDGDRCRLGSLGILVFPENLVEQVVFDLFVLDQLFGELGVVLRLLIAQGFEAHPEACRASRRWPAKTRPAACAG